MSLHSKHQSLTKHNSLVTAIFFLLTCSTRASAGVKDICSRVKYCTSVIKKDDGLIRTSSTRQTNASILLISSPKLEPTTKVADMRPNLSNIISTGKVKIYYTSTKPAFSVCLPSVYLKIHPNHFIYLGHIGAHFYRERIGAGMT